MKENRRAIIVGGAGGIGSAICRRLASEGYRMVVADFNLDGAREVLSSLDGEDHDAVQLDVMEETSVQAAFDAIEASSPASILVVASGGPVISLENRANLITMNKSDWDRTLAFNLTGVFTCVQKFAQLRLIAPMKQSRIVIIGSSVGQTAGSGTDIAYITSKAALFGFSREVAFDLAHANITVNIIAPGPVETPEFLRKTNEKIRSHLASITPLKRVAVPDEIGLGVSYLVSTGACFVTGTILDINGGVYMR